MSAPRVCGWKGEQRLIHQRRRALITDNTVIWYLKKIDALLCDEPIIKFLFLWYQISLLLFQKENIGFLLTCSIISLICWFRLLAFCGRSCISLMCRDPNAAL